MKKRLLVAVVALLAGTSSAVWAAGDAAAGKGKSAACAACHAIDGNSTIAANPKLAGQHAGYLSKQISEFKSGARKDPVMMPMVAALSDQDIADVSAYFAS